ncbi:MAG TPA: sugar phosphate isomerase/epimerase family protein [Bryobacteraceae bacterium]|nr:sugar phosphate isomerase/epimerase family protein [Bryobacteraceae bacterium]
MYLSLNPTLVADRVPWPEFARLAARVGYQGVDVSTSGAMKEGWQSTRKLLDQLKLTPAVAGFPVEFRKDDATFQRDFVKLEEAVQFVAAVGCPRMNTYLMSSSDRPKTEQRKIYKERLGAAAHILARSHVRLGLEFLGPVHLRKLFPYEFIWRMDEMLEFAKECGPNVGLELDSWHWHHAGATVKDIVAAGKENIINVQVNDSPKLPPEQIRDDERLMPGEGVIDLVSFFQALKEIGYDDGVSPEVFGRGLKNIPPEEGARLGLETTRAIMRKAGVA